MRASLPFTSPWLLAPMEGVTDPVFRGLVLSRHSPVDLGGAFTEFVRVVDEPVPRKVLRRHLGDERFDAPVGLQLMGRHLGALGASARRVVEVGAPILDLNFGCPAKGALRGCAGSALLRDPRAVAEVVSVCAEAVEGSVPVTAKIRAGYDDASQVEELAQAAEEGGASLLTIHCRTRAESYQEHVDWTRIARAVTAVAIPVCGNGGVRRHGDLARMQAETGCAYVMVGQAAMADPWVFSGDRPGPPEAARFLFDYVDRMLAAGRSVRSAEARLKQLVRVWTTADLVPDETERAACLRERGLDPLLKRLGRLAQARLTVSARSATP